MIIREATEADFCQVEPVLIEVEHHHVALEPEIFKKIDHYDQKQYTAAIQSPESRVFLAEIENEVVGAIIAEVRQWPQISIFRGGRYVDVEELSVRSAFQRRGVGTQLMKAVEEWARELEIEQVQFSVWVKNSGAVAFYESLGYHPFLLNMWKNVD